MDFTKEQVEYMTRRDEARRQLREAYDNRKAEAYRAYQKRMGIETPEIAYPPEPGKRDKSDGAYDSANRGLSEIEELRNRVAKLEAGYRGFYRPLPITLVRTAGSVGSDTTATTWTYTVTETFSEKEIGTAVNPTASPHLWRRPDVGPLTQATAGYGHYQSDGAGAREFVIVFINETLDAGACAT